jgi:hypothetical protein
MTQKIVKREDGTTYTRHTKSQPDYVYRKLAHMQRMGIACGLYKGAACPDWRKTELEAMEKSRG